MRRDKVVYGWFADGLPFYVGLGTVKRSRAKTQRNNYCLNKRAKAERENSFEIRILHKNLTWKEACEIEQSYISLYGRINSETGILTNMTDGGEGTIGRLCESPSKETRQKISMSLKGDKNPMYRKPVSKSTREKMSESRKGLRRSQESKNKISRSLSKLVMTPSGVFESCSKAANFLKVSNSTISSRIKDERYPDFYLI